MAEHNSLGVHGEEVAAGYLENRGYSILYRNWRYGRQEVDIIAQKEDTLVFVEVKTRRSHAHGEPEESVHPRKQAFLKQAAENYLATHQHDGDLRFDVVAVEYHADDSFHIRHIEDAFFHF